MDQFTGSIVTAAIPTLAVIAGFVRNETATAALNGRIETLAREMR